MDKHEEKLYIVLFALFYEEIAAKSDESMSPALNFVHHLFDSQMQHLLQLNVVLEFLHLNRYSR